MKENILLIHQGALGDLILTLTCFRGINQEYNIDICCREHLIPLVRQTAFIHHAFSVDHPEFALLFTTLPRSPRGFIFKKYQYIILFSNSSVFHKNICAMTHGRVYHIPPRPDPLEKIHITDFLFQHLQPIFPYMSRPKGSFSKRAFSYQAYDRIFLHPGSGSPRKNWPLRNYIQIYELLLNHGHRPEWIIGPAENKMANELIRFGLEKDDIHLNNSLSELYRLLSQPNIFIGNDSGVSHLSAFIGNPVITIFGPSDPVRWHPIGGNVKIIKADTECQPCFEVERNNCVTCDCLNDISQKQILTFFNHFIINEI